jgi:uncharacterized protein
MAPTMANGKICYLEMPATDIARSTEFFKAVFGWGIRKRGDGGTAFDDAVGEVPQSGRKRDRPLPATGLRLG